MTTTERKKTTKDDELRALKDFAHEIRTPMNSLMGYSHLIKDEARADRDPERLTEYAGIIESATRRLLHICERVLEDAHTDTTTVNRMPVDVGQLVAEILKTFEPEAKEREIELIADSEQGMPPAMTDPVLLGQILTNLISNAVKFTPSGGRVTVRTEVGPNRDALVFVISDTGHGIAPEILEKIRDGLGASTPPLHGREGFGRGLRITHRLCELLETKMSFGAGPDGGTVISFDQPLVE